MFCNRDYVDVHNLMFKGLNDVYVKCLTYFRIFRGIWMITDGNWILSAGMFVNDC